MKKVIFLVLVVCALFSNASANLTDVGSNEPYTMLDWGLVEPSTHGGNYGGMGSGTAPGSWDQLCRPVWSSGNANWAAVVYPEAISEVFITHLDGMTDDGFQVYVDDILWGAYTDSGSVETWKTTSFSGTPGTVLKIVATGEKWAYFETYGQLAIDRIEAVTVPAPGALLLGGLGTLLAGWMRRRVNA